MQKLNNLTYEYWSNQMLSRILGKDCCGLSMKLVYRIYFYLTKKQLFQKMRHFYFVFWHLKRFTSLNTFVDYFTKHQLNNEIFHFAGRFQIYQQCFFCHFYKIISNTENKKDFLATLYLRKMIRLNC